MQIAPRALLCGNAWRIGGTVDDAGFEELRDLCTTAGDKVSLALAMAGLVMALNIDDRIPEAAQLATECAELIESIGDPALIVALLPGPLLAKCQATEMVETLRLANRIIDLADGNATMGSLIIESPLAFAQTYRGFAELSLGVPGFREHVEESLATTWPTYVTDFAGAVMYKSVNIPLGVSLLDDTTLRETADALGLAEQSGDPLTLGCALLARGIALIHRDGPDSEAGYKLFEEVRALSLAHRFPLTAALLADVYAAQRLAHTSDIDGAIELSRSASRRMEFQALATTVLVESLLIRGNHADIAEAQAAIDTLAAVPTDPGYVLNELPLLRMRALLARAQGDDEAYRGYRDRYRKMANDLDFQGHMRWAEELPG
jgi:adenylate cyclase